MPQLQPTAIAEASIESASTWKWELKIDHCGLFRWYLDGMIDTNLRGATTSQAENALRRFVKAALRGDLQITYYPEHRPVTSEHRRPAVKAVKAG